MDTTAVSIHVAPITRTVRVVAAALALSACLTVARDARADDRPTAPATEPEPASADAAGEARSEYQLATQDYKLKCYADAATHFERAANLRANPIAYYTAGMAWDLVPRPDRAADAYTRAIELGGLDAKQLANAKERLTALESGLATIELTGKAGTVVRLGKSGEALVPVRLHAEPGTQPLVIRHPDGKHTEQRELQLEAGSVDVVEIAPIEQPDPPSPQVAPPPAPPPVAPAAQAPSFWSTRRVVGAFVGGVSLASFGAATALGISAKDAESAYVREPTRSVRDHASGLETMTNVSLITGAVLLAASVVLIVWPERGTAATPARTGTLEGAPRGGRF